MYYTVHDNSSFARLLLNTGDYLEILILDGCKYHLEEYIAGVLKRFLVKGEVNIAQVLYTIHDNRYSSHEDVTIANSLIQNKEILGKLKEFFRLVEGFRLKIKLLMFLRRSGIEETAKNEILDKSVLSTCGKQIRTANMMRTYLFLHSLASFQQEKAREFLDLITAKGLAKIYKAWFKKGDYTILELLHIRKILSKLQNEKFWLNFIKQFTEEEIVDLLNNSRHQQIYEFFQRRLSTNARQAYGIYLDQYTEGEILSQLKSLDLKQIGEFVHMHYWHRTVKKAYEK